MEDITSSAKPKGPYITVMVISVGALISTIVTLFLVHIMFIKYCKRRDQATHTLAIEPAAIGLDKRVLSTIPILFYSIKTCDFYRINRGGDQCVICLDKFIKGDLIRRLPICGHIFHVPCIDNWFNAHSNCPICRSLVRVSPLMQQKQRRSSIIPPPVRSRVNDYNKRDEIRGDDCIARTRSGCFLCHCDKVVLPIEGLGQRELIQAGLDRSLSMDHFNVVVDTGEHDTIISSPFSSSSYNSCNPPMSKIDFVLSRLYHTQSIELMASMDPRLLHGLGHEGGTFRNNGILPY